ncbi:hypothetical protein A1D22_05670 [Pasteurellaceae bacterium LFhippo2]|nr:hypothetical protein [Pasteurellaceae bacterium LFhippo2]
MSEFDLDKWIAENKSEDTSKSENGFSLDKWIAENKGGESSQSGDFDFDKWIADNKKDPTVLAQQQAQDFSGQLAKFPNATPVQQYQAFEKYADQYKQHLKAQGYSDQQIEKTFDEFTKQVNPSREESWIDAIATGAKDLGKQVMIGTGETAENILSAVPESIPYLGTKADEWEKYTRSVKQDWINDLSDKHKVREYIGNKAEQDALANGSGEVVALLHNLKENPMQIADIITQQVPLLVLGGMGGKALGAVNMLGGAGRVRNDIEDAYDDTYKNAPEQLLKLPEIQQRMAQGMTFEQAVNDAKLDVTDNWKSILAGAAIGGSEALTPVGKLGQGLNKGVLKTLGKEVGQEAAQEGAEQLNSNLAVGEIDGKTQAFDDVARNATLGGIAGLGTGIPSAIDAHLNRERHNTIDNLNQSAENAKKANEQAQSTTSTIDGVNEQALEKVISGVADEELRSQYFDELKQDIQSGTIAESAKENTAYGRLAKAYLTEINQEPVSQQEVSQAPSTQQHSNNQQASNTQFTTEQKQAMLDYYNALEAVYVNRELSSDELTEINNAQSAAFKRMYDLGVDGDTFTEHINDVRNGFAQPVTPTVEPQVAPQKMAEPQAVNSPSEFANKDEFAIGKQTTGQNEIVQNQENTAEEQSDLRLSLNESPDSDFAKAVDEINGGKRIPIRNGKFIQMGTTPDALKMVGVTDTNIKINESVIEKVMGEQLGISENKYDHIHNLTADDLKALPKNINNPIAIFKSSKNSSNPDGFVVLTELTELKTKTGKKAPVIAALHIKPTKRGVEVVNITSAYGRSDGQLRDAFNNDLLYADRTKAQQFLNTYSLQLGWDFTSDAELSARNIKTESDLSQYKNSQSNPQNAETDTEIQQARKVLQEVLGEHADKVELIYSSDVDPNIEDYENARTSEGYYLNGKMYVIVDNIHGDRIFNRTERLVWVAWHELGHRGVAVKLSGAYQRLMKYARTNAVVSVISRKLQERFKYEDDLATEEAIVELYAAAKTGNWDKLEQEYGVKIHKSWKTGEKTVGNFLEKVIAQLRRIVGAVFGKDLSKATNEDILSILKQVNEGVKSPQNQIASNGKDTVSSEPRYSLNEDPNSEFAKAVDDIYSNNYQHISSEWITLGTTPQALIQSGIDDLVMRINKQKIGRIKKEHPEVTDAMLKQIPYQLNNPVAVFKNNKKDSIPNSYVVLTKLKANNGQSVIVALHANRKDRALEFNKIASIYGREESKKYISNMARLSDVRFVDMKKARSISRQLQLLDGDTLNELFNRASVVKNDNAVNSKAENSDNSPKYSRRAKDEFTQTETQYGGKQAYEQAKANGETELDYRQWVQVRTPSFKQWFGDWENDPENASKVINSKTGEPLVVYHGSNSDFSVFEKTQETDYGWYGEGHYFTEDSDIANSYADIAVSERGGNQINYGVYLNLRNPNYVNLSDDSVITDKNSDSAKATTDKLKSQGFDGVVVFENSSGKAQGKTPYNFVEEVVAFDPTQIKSATDNTGEFDGSNPDIRFSRRAKPSLENAEPKRKASNFDEARAAVTELLGEPLVNRETGMIATISKRSMDKLLSGKASKQPSSIRDHLLAVANIDQLFENAVMGWTEKHKNDDSNFDGIYRMFAPLNVDGVMRLAKLTIKAMAFNQGNRIYSVESIDVENENGTLGNLEARADENQPTSPQSADVGSLIQKIKDFNSKAENSDNSPRYSRRAKDEFTQTETQYGGKQAYEQAKANGETELDYRQWVQVRTPSFKQWFGDWENDPENASKVVNEKTGEPLVVYHGSRSSQFNEFKKGERSKYGAFFTSKLSVAETYGGNVEQVFLNLKDAKEFDAKNNKYHNITGVQPSFTYYTEDGLYTFNSYDEASQFAKEHDDYWGEIVDFYPKGVSNEDIGRAAHYQGRKGAIIRNVRDEAVGGGKVSDVFIVYDSNNIKSATRNTGEFDGNNPDIRYSKRQSAMDQAKSGKSEPDKGIFEEGFKAAYNKASSKLDEQLSDSRRPVIDFIKGWKSVKAQTKQSLIQAMQSAEIIRDVERGKLEKAYTDPILDELVKLKNKTDLDLFTTKRLSGFWISARWSIEKNTLMLEQKHQAMKDAKDLYDSALKNSQDQAEIDRAELDYRKAKREYQDFKHDVELDLGSDYSNKQFKVGTAGGWSIPEAKLLMQEVENHIPVNELENLAERVYDLNQALLKLDHQSGRYTDEQIAEYSSHRHYVPLTGDGSSDNDIDFIGGVAQKAFNIGKDHRLIGRKNSEAEDAFDAMWKNLGKTTQYYGWADFKQQLAGVYDGRVAELKAQGLAERTAKEQAAKELGFAKTLKKGLTRTSDDVLIYKEGGKYYEMPLPRDVAGALRGDNTESNMTWLMIKLNQLLAKPTRLMTRGVTQFTIDFPIVNMIRDVMGKAIYIAHEDIYDKSGRALSAAERYAIGAKVYKNAFKYTASLDNLFVATFKLAWGMDLKDTGLQGDLKKLVNYGGFSTLTDHIARSEEDFVKQLKTRNSLPRKGIAFIAHLLNVWSGTFDAVSSLVTYKALQDSGIDEKQAAGLVLETANFRKRGAALTNARGAYMFLQPKMMDAQKMMKILHTPLGGAELLVRTAVMTGLYYALGSFWAYVLGDDEKDEGGTIFNQLGDITGFIPIPLGKQMREALADWTGLENLKGNYFKLHLGFGMNQIAWNNAFNLVRAWQGHTSWTDASVNIAMNWTKNFAPVTPSEISATHDPLNKLAQSVSPTALLPLVQLATNKNAFGAQITTGRTDPKEIRATQSKPNTAPEWETASTWLFDNLGIDMHPEQVKHLVTSYGIMAGTARETITVAIENPNRERLGKTQRIPILTRAFGMPNEYSIPNQFYEAKSEALRATAMFERYKQIGDREKALEFRKKVNFNNWTEELFKDNNTEKSNLKRQLNAKDISQTAYDRKMLLVRRREEFLQRKAVKKWRQMEGLDTN